MKFKVIFLSFNILIVFSFLMIFLLPVFMLGGEYSMQFWQDSWYIAVIFITILIFINLLYIFNRQMLGYLEVENWPELKKLLEDNLFEKKKLWKMYIRMYISTCIATSSINDIKRLEQALEQSNPGALNKWALPLGLPYLLSNDPDVMKSYFGRFLTVSSDDSGWIKWNYCFALMLKKDTDEAVEMLKLLSAEKKDSILRLSSLYMLSPFKNEDAIKTVLDKGCEDLRSSMNREDFIKELEKQRDNVQMLFLSKIFDEALDWLYQEQRA